MFGERFLLNEQTIPVVEEIGKHMPGGFFIYRAEEPEELLYANQAVFDIFGCRDLAEFKELTGYTFKGMLHPEDYRKVSDSITEQIEESEAEEMKLKYGSAYTDNSDIDNTLNYPLDDDRTVSSRKFVEIVEARLDEIIENVWCQVPSDYYDKLLGGIILTGGGANMTNIKKAFHNDTHVEKIRIAKFVNQTITSSNKLINSHDGRMNTLLGLLAKGDMNCAGGEYDANAGLFDKLPQPMCTAWHAAMMRLHRAWFLQPPRKPRRKKTFDVSVRRMINASVMRRRSADARKKRSAGATALSVSSEERLSRSLEA